MKLLTFLLLIFTELIIVFGWHVDNMFLDLDFFFLFIYLFLESVLDFGLWTWTAFSDKKQKGNFLFFLFLFFAFWLVGSNQTSVRCSRKFLVVVTEKSKYRI
jgi:hypothetical protein